MAHQSDPVFSILHTLRLRGRIDLEGLSRSSGIAEDRVADELKALDADGLVTYREGRAAGWSLTPDGRQRHQELLAADCQAAGCGAVVQAGYDQFLAINTDLIATCTRWQMKDEQTLNDHTDANYDASIIAGLRAIDVAVQPACEELGGSLERMSLYGPRLATALDRLDGGEHQWFTSPAIDSYHTVWFELHEDLLLTLGIERGEGR